MLSDKIVMMTNGPSATIGEVLDIQLERPRNRVELANDPQYQGYRQSVLKFLYEKQLHPTPQSEPSASISTSSKSTSSKPTSSKLASAKVTFASDIKRA